VDEYTLNKKYLQNHMENMLYQCSNSSHDGAGDDSCETPGLGVHLSCKAAL
jgi:hypothetical protein